MEGSVADTLLIAERRRVADRRRALIRAVGRAALSLALVVVVLGAGFGAFRYMVATRPQVVQAPPVERARLVDARTITVGPVTPTLPVFGQVVAGRAVDLRVLVAGEVRRVAPGLAEGGMVRAGETIVAIERFDYEGAVIRARADLAEAEARVAETEARLRAEADAIVRLREQLVISEREIGRLGQLASRDIASEAQLDQARLRVSSARAAVESRENQTRILDAQRRREVAVLDRLRFAVAKAERDLEQTELRAPYDAIVSNVAVDVGRLMSVSDRVATLTDPGRLEVRFTLNDAQYGRLAATGALEGRAVRVVWRGGDVSRAKPATIVRVAPVVVANTGGFDVFARIDDPAAAAALRPGAFVEIAVPDRTFAGVVALPASAIHVGDVVYRIGVDGRLAGVTVRRVGFSGDEVLVEGAFETGQSIMTTRLAEAGERVLVEIRR